MGQGIGKQAWQYQWQYLQLTLISLLMTLLIAPVAAWAAEDTVCAVVKIEIPQELTLERQGFEAIMKINNALEDTALTHVAVEVLFQDAAGDAVVASSDPNHPNAKFFIRIATLEGIDNVAGTGELAAASSATINWLIIPAPGTGGDVASGTLYYVGAKLSYRINGLDESLDVAPDTIFVKPMPKLTLDYFLPTDVYADDPLTNEIEPVVPFTLGVRVRNNGKAAANKVKIESAQPKIVENNQGLLIDFKITDSFIDERAVNNSLLLDFGDIASNDSATGRWIMQTSLSGRFTEFDASFSHADELGGSLTSLIESVNAHLLVHDVQVDLPGRDAVRDFLVRQVGALTVFESDSVDTPVVDGSASAGLTLSAVGQYRLAFAPEVGAVYVQLADVTGGSQQLVQAVRSDGKVLQQANVWQSKTYDKEQHQWLHSLHLFDTQSTGNYILSFTAPAVVPAAPVLQFVPNWTGAEGGQIGFLLEASDPNGDAVSLSVNPLPSGATLTQIEPGKVRFNWPIAAGQAGHYPLTVTASDGALFTNQAVMLTVFPENDTDGDGLDDDWERLHFGDLSRDGSGDFDGDGISDREEFDKGTDPTLQNGPLAPAVVSPNAEVVVDADISLVVDNSVNLGVQTLSYFFEVYADPQMSQKVLSSEALAEGVAQTRWLLPSALQENQHYSWRVRSYNGILYSPWSNGTFLVNRVPEAPTAVQLNSPVVGTEVDSTMPQLSVVNASDPDGDELLYQFSVFADEEMQTLVARSSDIVANPQGVTQWRVTQALDEGSQYYWQAIAKDAGGLNSTSNVFWFSVYSSNQLPTAPTLVAPTVDETIGLDYVDLVVKQAVDPEGDTLSYHFELDTVATFDSADKQVETFAGIDNEDVVWSVNGLVDRRQYFWRVRAEDSLGGLSEPMLGQFNVNLTLTAPVAPMIDNPGDGSWVQSLMPILSIHGVANSDRPIAAYEYEVYSDAELTQLIVRDELLNTAYELPLALQDNTWAYWRVRAIDSADIRGAWSAVARFFVNDQGIDEAPTFVWKRPLTDVEIAVGEKMTLGWEDTDPDSDALISLSYVRPQDAIVMDNSDPGFTAYGEHWEVKESGEDGSSYHVLQAHKVDALAKWERPLEMAGRYEVQVYWPQIESKYAKQVSYAFAVQQDSTSVLITKKIRKPKAGWISLGEHMLAGGDFTLFLKGRGHKKRALIADSIRLIPVDVPEQLIASDLPETPDAEADTYLWDTQDLVPGQYQLLARITDGSQQLSVLSPFVISLRAAAELTLDNSDVNASYEGDWALTPAIGGAIGDDIHEIQLTSAPNEPVAHFTWLFELTTTGWHSINFRNLPGYDARMLSFKLVSGKHSVTLGGISDTDSATWVSLSKLWLDAGEYRLVVSASGQGKAAVDAVEIQRVLVAGGDDITIDNRSLGFSSRGDWESSVSVAGFKGIDYMASCRNATAEWRMFLPDPGTYEVFGNWTSRPNRASNTRFKVSYSAAGENREALVQVNQRKHGGRWQSLGVYDFDAAKVSVSTTSRGANGCVIADAIRFKKVMDKSYVLDNISEQFSVTRGWWTRSSLVEGFIGQDYQFSMFGNAKWHMQLPELGVYRVEARWPAHFFHTTKAQYSISSASTILGKTKVNQGQNGGAWQLLGEFQFDSNELEVMLENKGAGFLISDAIRLTKVETAL
jgi:hypothetical protein